MKRANPRLFVMELWENKTLKETKVFRTSEENFWDNVIGYINKVVKGRKQLGVLLNMLEKRKGGSYNINGKTLKWYRLP